MPIKKVMFCPTLYCAIAKKVRGGLEKRKDCQLFAFCRQQNMVLDKAAIIAYFSSEVVVAKQSLSYTLLAGRLGYGYHQV